LQTVLFLAFFAVPKIVPTRQFCKGPLDSFGLRMAVPLRNRDRAVPCDPRQSERIAARFSKPSQGGVSQAVRLEVLHS